MVVDYRSPSPPICRTEDEWLLTGVPPKSPVRQTEYKWSLTGVPLSPPIRRTIDECRPQVLEDWRPEDEWLLTGVPPKLPPEEQWDNVPEWHKHDMKNFLKKIPDDIRCRNQDTNEYLEYLEELTQKDAHDLFYLRKSHEHLTALNNQQIEYITRLEERVAVLEYRHRYGADGSYAYAVDAAVQTEDERPSMKVPTSPTEATMSGRRRRGGRRWRADA